MHKLYLSSFSLSKIIIEEIEKLTKWKIEMKQKLQQQQKKWKEKCSK